MKRMLLCCLLLSLTACGYHLPGQESSLPGGVKTLYVPLFVNHTKEPLLENRLTNDVSEILARNGQISLVESRKQADALLKGVVSAYHSDPISYDKNDRISEYRSTMQIAVKLIQVSDGRLLWQGTLSWSSEYAAAADKMLQEDLEQQAIDEISRRLAEELYYRLLDNF